MSKPLFKCLLYVIIFLLCVYGFPCFSKDFQCFLHRFPLFFHRTFLVTIIFYFYKKKKKVNSSRVTKRRPHMPKPSRVEHTSEKASTSNTSLLLKNTDGKYLKFYLYPL